MRQGYHPAVDGDPGSGRSVGRMKRGVALGLVFALVLESSGCATLNAPLMDSCRGSDGRFAVCPSGGGGGDALLIGLGVAAAVGLIAGISYLATRSPSTPAEPAGPDHDCLDAAGRTVTLAARQSCTQLGYFDPLAVPAPIVSRPGATHRCRAPNGEESDFAADQSCAAAGYTDAPGGPRALRCYDRAGMVVASAATSCGAAGLASARGEPAESPASPVPPGPTRLHCFDARGEPVVTDYASCSAGGYFDTVGASTAAPSPAEPAEAAAERHAAVAHTCVGRMGTMLDLAIDQPCPRGYIDRDAPRRRRRR